MLAYDRHKNVEGLNRSMVSEHSPSYPNTPPSMSLPKKINKRGINYNYYKYTQVTNLNNGKKI
jgi:hypothetical protein